MSTTYGLLTGTLIAAALVCGGCKSVTVQVTVNMLTTRSTALNSASTATNNAVKTSMVVTGGGANSNSAIVPASVIPMGVRQ